MNTIPEAITARMREARDTGNSIDDRLITLEEVYNTHASGLLRYARALLGSAEDAEDAVQEVFVRLARRIDGVRRIRDLRRYLLKATRNAAYEFLRGKQRRDQLIESAAREWSDCSPDRDDCEVEAVLKAFAVLPPEQREVFALKVFQGLTFREIARVIGKSQNTASSRYRYAVERIRQELGVKDDGS